MIYKQGQFPGKVTPVDGMLIPRFAAPALTFPVSSAYTGPWKGSSLLLG